MFVLKHWSGKCVRAQSGSTNPANNDYLVFSDSCSTSKALLFKKVYHGSGSAYFSLQLQNGKCIHPDGGFAHTDTKLVAFDGCGNEDRILFTFAAERADFVLQHKTGMCVHPNGGTTPVDGQYLVTHGGCYPASKLGFTEMIPPTDSSLTMR